MESAVLIFVLPMLMFILLGIGGKYMTHRTAGRLGTLGLTVITVLAYVTAYRYFGAGRSGGV